MPTDRRPKRGYLVVLKDNQPLTLEAVRLSFADPATPRERVVGGQQHGDREERRTLELFTEIVLYLAARSTARPAAAGGVESCETSQGDWPGLTHVAQVVREVE